MSYFDLGSNRIQSQDHTVSMRNASLVSQPLPASGTCTSHRFRSKRIIPSKSLSREVLKLSNADQVTVSHSQQTQLHNNKSGGMSKQNSTEVPHTFSSVMRVFLSHPSAAVPAAAICGLVMLRLQQPLTALDVPIAAAVVLFWLLQEWVVHKFALHSEMEWMGKTIHREHHETPYFHISLDPPELILSVMAIAAVVFLVLFQGGPYSLTATAAYYTAGLGYEWLHYVVHTRWVPPAGWPGNWLRAVRRHHMLHHCRNEEYWLSFSWPAVDGWFGTLPASAGSVPLTAMARKGHSATAAAGQHGNKAALAATAATESSVPAGIATAARR